MSLTGLDIRQRFRRRLARWIDQLADRIDPPPPPSPSVPDDPPASQATSASPPPPLPDLPKPSLRDPAAGVVSRDRPAPTATVTTPAAQKASESPEERQARHWTRTREGLLRFVDDAGGSASLRDLHDYSERTFFVAHVQFSKLMEELTDEGLLDYDEDTATGHLTEAGHAEIDRAAAG